MTFDVWHTLIYLSPQDEEEYYRAQIALGVEALREAARLPDSSGSPDAELARVFARALAAAVAEAGHGRSVTPAQQIVRAGTASGRAPNVEGYGERLARLVADQPFRPAPGALSVLEGLHRDGYRIGVVGSTVGEAGASLRPVLGRLGLDRPVDAFVFSDEEPWAKPAPEIFWEALRRLDAAPDETVHVGDAWSDIEGARRARLLGSVWFTGLQEYGAHYRTLNIPSTKVPARHVAREFGDVDSIVRRLLPAGKSGAGGRGPADHRTRDPTRGRRR